MNKSELIEILAEKHNDILLTDVKSAIDTILEYKMQSLASGERIEVRGFGSFNIRYIAPRMGRNPKTGEEVSLSGRYKTHFKPGKELRDRVNGSVN